MKSTVLVIGATGHVGRHAVEALRRSGASVRAFVRDPDRAAFPDDVELSWAQDHVEMFH